MRVDRALRVSNYLTLGLACGCLGYAELPFLPAMPWILLGVAGMMVVAFFLDGRWSLPVWAANVVGTAIIVGALAWVARLYVQAEREVDTVTGDLPWPAAALPHLGPMIMALLVVKLFRVKGYHDYWLLHTVGFLHVALACVLTGEPLFGLLLWGYLMCALWCLTLLQVGPALEAPKERLAGSARVPWRMLGLWRAGRWALVCGFMGLLLFLVVPRQGNLTWDGGRLTWTARQQIQMGQSGTMDLKLTGTLTVSEEKAFEVTVTEGTVNGPPKVNLSPSQLWRSRTLDRYVLGRWTSTLPYDLPQGAAMPMGMPGVPMVMGPGVQPQQLPDFQKLPKRLHVNSKLPDLGRGQYVIAFNVDPRKVGGLVLAEPIILGPGLTDHPYEAIPADPPPLKPADPPPLIQLFYETDGTLNPMPTVTRRHHSYLQVAAPMPRGQEGRSRPRWFRELARGYPLPQDAMRLWTRQLLDRLAAEGRYGLTPAHLAPGPNAAPLQPANFEAVARALCDYLATSGEYTYSLNLRREDRRLDPALDFLRNVKAGHCQRFAGALAVMLHSQGIPSRVVLGFRGAEHQGGGRYVVRQSYAHSWVEALVPAPVVAGREPWCWVTLDPTPAGGGEGGSSSDFVGFWQGAVGKLHLLWQGFVVEFNPEQQRAALLGLWELLAPGDRLVAAGQWAADAYAGRFWAEPGFWVLTLAGGGILFWVGRRVRWSRAGITPAGLTIRVGFYARLLAMVARYCRLRPGTGQTPREFGEVVGNHLRASETAGDLADLPVRLAGWFYQVRFGEVALAETEVQDIDRQLNRLEGALSQGPKT